MRKTTAHMMLDVVIIYALISMVAMGLIIGAFFRFQYGVADLETKITGIWSNWDDSMRVLIYNINSQIKGEVVWTDNNNDKLLGTTVIKDIHLEFFGWSKGTYIDPLTRSEFRLKLKMKNSGKLKIHLLECGDPVNCKQQWNLVK